ncbi:MAG TPA: MFS transporter [Polyangiaceae bacterium]|nr:MFS transporter [Polyangiaceae bacterium]
MLWARDVRCGSNSMAHVHFRTGTPSGRSLEALNFFMADMQAGIGPFLGVFLLAHGWRSGRIGAVMTLGGVAGMIMTAPAGALVDATSRKRAYVIVPGIFTLLASAIVLLSQRFWLVAASQVATAIAGAAIGPAVAGMTLGLAGQTGFIRQNGRNQAWNHAGNTAGAALSGLLGWKLGLPAVFWLAAIFGVLSIVSVLTIPASSIDNRVARGLGSADKDGTKATGFRVLVESKPLVVLAAALACFHLGNGAMLPLYGLAMVAAKQGDPARLVATTIVIAQGVMIVASVLATRMAERSGYWLVILISFVALPLRGIIAAHLVTNFGVIPVQVLDGVGAGLQSVAVPGLVARILQGTGRVNVGQGAVMTVQGLGAALSPAIGGWIAEKTGYPAAFTILGSLAVVSLLLWTVFRVPLRSACGAPSRASPSGVAIPAA